MEVMDLIKDDIHSDEYHERMQSNLEDLYRRFEKSRTHCANEAYDRAASDDDKNAPRFISCPCPKCSVRS